MRPVRLTSFFATWPIATTFLSLICFGPMIIDGHLVYLQKLLHTLRTAAIIPAEAHVMEHPRMAASTYSTIRSAYFHAAPTPPASNFHIRLPAGQPPGKYYNNNHHSPYIHHLSPLMHSSAIATVAAIPLANGYASDWTPIVPNGHVVHQQTTDNIDARKLPKKIAISSSAFRRTILGRWDTSTYEC